MENVSLSNYSTESNFSTEMPVQFNDLQFNNLKQETIDISREKTNGFTNLLQDLVQNIGKFKDKVKEGHQFEESIDFELSPALSKIESDIEQLTPDLQKITSSIPKIRELGNKLIANMQNHNVEELKKNLVKFEDLSSKAVAKKNEVMRKYEPIKQAYYEWIHEAKAKLKQKLEAKAKLIQKLREDLE